MRRLEQFGHTHAWSALTLHQVQVVVEEWMENLLSHAMQPGIPLQTELRLDDHPSAWVLTLTDNGPAFDPLKEPTPKMDLDLDDIEPGGWGLHLMRNLAASIHYQRQNGLNCLTLEFKK